MCSAKSTPNNMRLTRLEHVDCVPVFILYERMYMNMQYLFIFAGGALGALLRYLLSFINSSSEIPMGTFIANLCGAFLMGYLGTLTIKYFKNNPLLKKGVTTGFLGALTTFSTFQFELVQYFEKGALLLVIIYALTSYIFGILLCYIGVRLGEKTS